jgi:hypothetical protein
MADTICSVIQGTGSIRVLPIITTRGRAVVLLIITTRAVVL